ncbi:MAG: class I SAM-dependent methyltransferase [Verrucomicrobiota bacterium]
MSHQDTYTHNEAYAEFLANWDENFYAKYADTLKPARAGDKVLDVGCGAGQVVARLTEAGYEAHGVDVSEPSIERAKKFCPRCQVYDGTRLPYPDDFFESAGALNVLEHVENPEAFITELVRVVAPNGRVVISSPNFLRAIGFRDYHPKMRGLKNKWANFKRIQDKRDQMARHPDLVRFDRMIPIVKEPFEPDDDAIIATNGLEIAFFLERSGCKVEQVACTDRYVAKPLDLMLNATPLRYLMFSGFVVAKKLSSKASR